MNRSEIITRLKARNIAFDDKATDRQLLALLNQHSRVTKMLNYAAGKIAVAFNQESDEPAEILIYEDIGKDPWTGEGLTAKDVRDALNEITPKTRDLRFRTNSRGGSVNEGIAIRSLLLDWQGRIINVIDGIAASTASWCIPADEVQARKASQIFMHQSLAAPVGNADELEDVVAFLRKVDNQIAEIYADRSGKGEAEMLQLMTDETLLTGQEAKDLGLVDTLIDGDAVRNFSTEEISAMKQKLSAFNSIRNSAPKAGEKQTQKESKIMNKAAMIALLNKWGVTIPENATDDQLIKLVEAGKPLENKQPPADPNATELLKLQNQVKDLTELNNTSKKIRITNEVKALVANDQLPAALEAKAIDRAMKDEEYLNELKSLPARPPGAEPLSASSTDSNLDVVNADIKDITNGFERHNEATNAWKRGNDIKMDTIRNAAVNKANFFRKYQNRLLAVMNANTIPTELKRQVILQDIIRDFVRRLLPLSMFSTVYQNVPLLGLNTVEVPFYDLDASASTSFVTGTGYTTIGNTVTDKREITIGEGAANGDRLFQALAFSSAEIARQPYLNISQLARLKVEKLASDIFADVLGIITAANFGAASKTESADMFDSDDVADMKLACKLWPEMGRALMMDSAYDVNLLKDPSFKHALNAASDLAIKEGRLYPRVMGFDYTEIPTIPTNGENLVGFAAFKSAILFATAPVPPADEVRNAGTIWEMVTDPQTGISFEYRRFGANVTDAATNVVECSYGFAKGNGGALKRITSAA